MWTFEPRIPMGLWWALAALSAAVIVLYLLRRDWSVGRVRRWIITLMMLLGLVGPLAVTLNPVHIQPIPRPSGKPRLTVLLDGTASMTVEDADGDRGQSRWARGLELARRVAPQRDEIEVIKQVFYSDEVRTLPAAGDESNAGDTVSHGHRTDLASALGSVVRNGSPLGHAIVLLSDGAHNAGTTQSVLSRAAEANSLATPVYTVTLGSEVGLKNLSVASRSPRMIAFPNQDLILRARLGHAGLAGQSTRVRLLADSDVIDQQTVQLGGDPNQSIRFTIPGGPRESLQRFRIVASGVPGEATTSDNETTIFVQRLDAPISVLLLEGKPYWDSKFLSRNLSGDPMVRLTSIVRLGNERFLQRRITPTFEASDSNARDDAPDGETTTPNWQIQTELASPLETMELLDDYRIVLLGRDADRFLTPQGIENLRQWIARSGGCLVCARGAPSNEIATRLAEILPVRWEGQSETRFRTRVTQHGLDTALFDPLLSKGRDTLASLPSLSSSAIPRSRRGLPQVLIQSVADGSGNTVPVVTYQHYGSGQTIVVEGAGMWRWAFLPPDHADKDDVYWSLWQSLIAWVISSQDFLPGQPVAIRPDRATFLAGNRVTASLLVREPSQFAASENDLGLSVLLESADSELPRRFHPAASGLQEDFFRVDFGNLSVGIHSARVVVGDSERVVAQTSIEVRDPWFERLEVDARPDLMRGIARQSGGEVIDPDKIESVVERYEQRLRSNQSDRVRRTTLWDHPLALISILGAWVATWIVRRRSGLI
nr:vWA domain-containing protein [Rhodopirellula sp. SM50]